MSTKPGTVQSAIRRAFGRLDAARLDAVLGGWMWTRTRVVASRRVIAIDAQDGP